MVMSFLFCGTIVCVFKDNQRVVATVLRVPEEKKRHPCIYIYIYTLCPGPCPADWLRGVPGLFQLLYLKPGVFFVTRRPWKKKKGGYPFAWQFLFFLVGNQENQPGKQRTGPGDLTIVDPQRWVCGK